MKFKLSEQAWRNIVEIMHRVEVDPMVQDENEFYAALSRQWIEETVEETALIKQLYLGLNRAERRKQYKAELKRLYAEKAEVK